jgi:hypothetical protein
VSCFLPPTPAELSIAQNAVRLFDSTFSVQSME